MEYVILVDENDNVLGQMEKLRAHKEGLLHRAFSVFIINDKKELLIQQRAITKYHSPMKWTNSCCSHPRYGETYQQAAHRRLREELGIDCDLENKFSFIYKANVGEGLIEHELDYVFFGKYNQSIENFNKDEVENIRWISFYDLEEELKTKKESFTEWFVIIFDKYKDKIKW